MKAWRVYLMVAWALRTPFVVLLDRRYLPVQSEWVRHLAQPLSGVPYMAEIHDCDDYAFRLKALIGSSCGVVAGSGHAWNVVLCADGVWQMEPQTGELFKHGPYRPWVAIL